MLSRWPRSFLVLALLSAFPSSGPLRAVDPDAAPLPEASAFLRDVRERLHTDEFLLDQYTFSEKRTERRFDGDGKVKKSTSELYQVYPSTEPGHTYRKLVVRDGKPLPPEELAREDREQEEKESRQAAKLGGSNEQKRAAAEAERRQKESNFIDELFRVYDIQMAGREANEGRDAIVFAFRPRPESEPVTRAGKILKRFAGRVWIDEQDRQLVRVEAESIDDVSFGLGILAKLKKGARVQFQRRKVNDEIWLPSKNYFAASARILLVKAVRLDSLSEYSDYRKFTVATDAAVTPEAEK